MRCAPNDRKQNQYLSCCCYSFVFPYTQVYSRAKPLLCFWPDIFVIPYFVSPGVGLFRKKQLLCRIIDAREDSKESGVEDCLEVGCPSVRDAKYKPRVDARLAR